MQTVGVGHLSKLFYTDNNHKKQYIKNDMRWIQDIYVYSFIFDMVSNNNTSIKMLAKIWLFDYNKNIVRILYDTLPIKQE